VSRDVRTWPHRPVLATVGDFPNVVTHGARCTLVENFDSTIYFSKIMAGGGGIQQVPSLSDQLIPFPASRERYKRVRKQIRRGELYLLPSVINRPFFSDSQ
jgi:hypothetical protein